MEANVVVLSNCPESNDVVHSTIGEIDGGSNDLGESVSRTLGGARRNNNTIIVFRFLKISR